MGHPPQGLQRHYLRHIDAGIDEIIAALDGRAIALTTQGDIVFASGPNAIARLGPGVAGEALITGGPAADPSWAAPTPAAHAPTHKDGGTDELDVSELAGAIGGAGEVPETDGAAVTWVDPDGRYDPKAHVLATTGPHTDTLPLTDLVVGTRGGVIIRGAADWEELAVGTSHQVFETQGAGADPQWAWAGLEIQTQAGEWADPTGGVYEGRAVLLYNSTQVEYRLVAYMNSGWRNVELIG